MVNIFMRVMLMGHIAYRISLPQFQFTSRDRHAINPHLDTWSISFLFYKSLKLLEDFKHFLRVLPF